MDTLVAATRLGGEIMGRRGELGLVKPGALADLLLVDGDPLADIEVLLRARPQPTSRRGFPWVNRRLVL